jgi:two-component system chemotaxis response regulator CheY
MSVNILIVDDSSVMRSMILKTLKMCGVPLGEVYQAANGEEGLAALHENWIDLVLLDINMPVMNGEEMVERMQADPELADIATVVVSTESSENRIQRLKEKGVSFVHKPFTPEEIRDKIQDVLGLQDIGADDENTFE